MPRQSKATHVGDKGTVLDENKLCKCRGRSSSNLKKSPGATSSKQRKVVKTKKQMKQPTGKPVDDNNNVQGLSIPIACIGSGDPVRVLRLYTTNTLDIF